MIVYYFYDKDWEKERGQPKENEWTNHSLFIMLNNEKPEKGKKVIMTSHGVSKLDIIDSWDKWKEWPFKSPNEFCRLVIEVVFTRVK